MAVSDLDVYKTHSPEIMTTLVELAKLARLVTFPEAENSVPDILLEQLLRLCTTQSSTPFDSVHAALFLTTQQTLPLEHVSLPTTRPLRLLALHQMSEEQVKNHLTFAQTTNIPEQFSLRGFKWLIFRLPIGEFSAKSYLLEKFSKDEYSHNRKNSAASLQGQLLQALLIIGWSDFDEQVATLNIQRAGTLLSLVADAAGSVIVHLLQAEEIRHLEEQVSKAELQKVEHLKSELLGTVSHELRSPLASIKGYAATLLRHERRLPREERREFLNAINQSSDKLGVLIDRLLEMSQLETNTIKLELASIDLVHLAREAITAAEEQVAKSASLHKLKLTVLNMFGQPAQEVPFIIGDQRRLREVLDNILENAIRYSPSGGEIEIVLRPVEPGLQCGAQNASFAHCSCIAERKGRTPPPPCKPMLAISICDNGTGIPEEHLDRIFDRFHRVDTRMTRTVNGLGLGLAICKSIIALHHGAIWAESKPDEGSTFHIWLPIDTDSL